MNPIDRLKKDTQIANKALATGLAEAFHKMATAKMPFLSWPVLAQAYKFFVGLTLEFALEKGAIFFNVLWIRVEVGNDAADLESARQKAIKAVNEGAKDEDLDKADDEMRRAFDRLHRGNRGRV